MRATMKRSRYVALLAMGASALALTACGESESPAGVYTSVDQCIADKQFAEADCNKAFATAKDEHKKAANAKTRRRKPRPAPPPSCRS
jgi:uncharacterized protein YgiB involved in biofilm formation